MNHSTTAGRICRATILVVGACVTGCSDKGQQNAPPAAPIKQPNSVAEVNRLLKEGQIANQQLADQMLRQSRPFNGKLNLELNLADTQLTDAELKSLILPDSLTRVNLTRTQITDEGLAHLATGKNIVELVLIDTRVSTKGLEHLRTMPRLRTINLHDTDVSPAEQLEFQKFLGERPWKSE